MKKELVLENYGVQELQAVEKQEVDGGIWPLIAVGVITYIIAEDWQSVKRGIRDAAREYFH